VRTVAFHPMSLLNLLSLGLGPGFEVRRRSLSGGCLIIVIYKVSGLRLLGIGQLSVVLLRGE